MTPYKKGDIVVLNPPFGMRRIATVVNPILGFNGCLVRILVMDRKHPINVLREHVRHLTADERQGLRK
jgi:hypothetical protein